jgi:hypothetical protein
MMKPIALAAFALFASSQAYAYCIVNELAGREVKVEQEQHPSSMRNERRLRATLAPGEKKCCDFHQLDCNPEGRNNSFVNLAISIPGEPAYECSFPAGSITNVKVTGAGTIRILPNPNKKSANPYIMRIRTHDKDVTGPKGVPCAEPKTKGKK